MRDIVRIADHAGTLIFALAAIAGGFDPVGVLVLVFATALGGGVMRDILIGIRPAAVQGWEYAAIVLVGAAGTWLLYPLLGDVPVWAIIVLDAAGLALFVVAGTEKAIAHDIHRLPAIFLGTLGGVGGGVVRDMLLNVAPRILHTDIYPSAAMLGAAIVVLGRQAGGLARLVAIIGGLACFAVRIAAVAYGWHLPWLVVPG